ncbi:MAG: helix-turn-helix transcriptional regulator [Acidobacteria bacterium]|nr:helix-turn-helix transcriptional regulator [Acidobacteriota bacterium]MBI3423129.1 helix-turn-helix transcriptional regulator [Acidobacteriota bacterium]
MVVRVKNRLDQDTWQRLCRARRLMDQHYQQPLNLDRLAHQACFSRFHFLRLFQQYFGKTPHQYLTEKRIQRAKELLDASRLPVTEVCFEVGFASLGSFSTLFRKVAGVSPAHYRARFDQPRPLATPAQLAAIPACFLMKFGGLPAAAR